VPSVSKAPAVVAQPSGGSLRPKLGANAGSPKIIPVALDEQRHQLEERIWAEKVRALELNMQESKQTLWKCLVGQKNFRVVFPLFLFCCQIWNPYTFVIRSSQPSIQVDLDSKYIKSYQI
jgi:hypothetical protein